MGKTSGSFQKGHKYCGHKEGSFLGMKHSEESNNKNKEKHLGKKYPNRKSSPLTEEHKKNIKKGNIGLKRTGLALQHIINTNQKPWTEERRKKMAESKTGDKNPAKREEVKEKIRLTKSKNPNRYWWGKKRFDMIGDKNSSWKGGITPENHKIRHSLESKFWKRECLKRDNFICQKTGQKGGELEVHHINNFADFPELRFDINNGITLSKQSHKEFHHIYGNKNNTKEQLDEFLINK
jgi:hypothetical protein